MTHMVFYVVKLLNYFPEKGGVSEIYGPKTIMSGKIINFKKFLFPSEPTVRSMKRNCRETA